MDYILADAVVIPPGEEAFYAETVVRLPHSYQINDNRRGLSPAPSRVALGLPEGAFVFCHFNYSYKILPGMFASWMRILAAVPGSVLWLLKTDDLFEANLRAAAHAAGVDADRLIFAPQLPVEQHVARLAAGDLFLDSLPYGAHTTGSDALWAGLPLLTCRGRSFAGRVGASLLTALELPELIAEDMASYEAMAVALARDPARLAGLRARLTANRSTAPLFDTAASTRAIEAAYETMMASGLTSPEACS
jgi:predicted O-linked N-acetylglucosamine transferase (SPINDLY family)